MSVTDRKGIGKIEYVREELDRFDVQVIVWKWMVSVGKTQARPLRTDRHLRESSGTRRRNTSPCQDMLDNIHKPIVKTAAGHLEIPLTDHYVEADLSGIMKPSSVSILYRLGLALTGSCPALPTLYAMPQCHQTALTVSVVIPHLWKKSTCSGITPPS
jgi:hypothetical protein